MNEPDIGHAGSSHFDEMTGLLYLEQQLDDMHSKILAEHSAGCPACRELLRVLKNETVWLRDAIVADDETVPVRLVAVPARSMAPWGWLATLGFGTAGAYTLWSGVIQPWVTQASNIGITQGNLMTMLFFSGAFWNGWSDVGTAVKFLAMITLGVVAAWALRRYFRRQAGAAAVMGMLGLAILVPAPAHAAETVHGNPSYTLPQGQEIKTDLFVAGDHVLIDGTVDGDLVVWAHEVEVNGQVKGDIIAFTQELRMNGTVGGNVRAFAESMVLSGPVGRNVMGFVRSVEVDEKSTIGGSATLFSRDVQLNGPIKGDLLAMAGTMEVDGTIGGNVKVRGEDMRIGSTAQVGGRTQFEGPKQPEIAAGARLASPVEMIMRKATPAYSTWTYYWHQILRWGAAFLLGLVLFLLAPAIFLDASNAANKVGVAMGIGLLFLVGIPVAVIIACVTIVGLGVGITTFLIYLVAVYMSQVFVGEWLGEKLLGVGVGIGPVLARLALGLAILRVIRVIPFLGPLSMWVVIVWGLGAYVLTLHKRMRHQVATASA